MAESQEFLQSALDALSARIAVLDAQGRILAVNTAWRRFCEESMQDPVGIGADYLALSERGGCGASPEDGRAAAAGIRSVADGRAQRFVMDYGVGALHEERWFQMTVTRFEGPGPVRLVVAHEEITAHKKAEAGLRRSDERYRAFLEHSSEAIWRFEVDAPVPVTLEADAQIDAFYRHAYLAECNDATARMYGYERADELVGAALADLMPRDDPANVDYLRRFISCGYRLTDGESHEHDRDGSPRHFLNNLVGIVENGHLLRAWGTQRDITPRMQAELALRDSEQRYRSLVSATAAIVVVADSDGCFTAPQPAWQAYTGQTWEDCRGYGYIDALHAEDRQAAERAWEEARRERRMFEYEARLRHAPSGSYRSCVARVVPVFEDDGSVREWVSSIADVDERRRAERLAERARAEAERANAAKDAFLATLSHELRAPLQGALGWATLLRSGGMAPDQRAKGLATLERCIRQQAQLVNDLLDVSRIISGKLHLEQSAVDLALVLAQVRDEFQLVASNSGVQLTVAFPAEGTTVMGDAERLAQIFRNLVANAIKFTPAGGRVAITCETRAHDAVVTVVDSGHGIAAEFLPHVFERFSQADASITRQHSGLGLGLGIVRHLVALHGGTVEADSAGIGQGATFRVTLPTISAGNALPLTASALVKAEATDSLHSVRVCLVEDDNDTRAVLAELLAQAGAQVTAASGARAALELFADTPPDVIVTDLGMPGEDGFWLAQRVRAAGLGVPIVALTGFADTEMKARVLAEGFQAHVAKPVEPEMLIAMIRSLLDRRA